MLSFRNNFLTGDIPSPKAWLKLSGSLVHTDGEQRFSDNPWETVYQLGLRETQVGFFKYSKKLKAHFAKFKLQFVHPDFCMHLSEATQDFLENVADHIEGCARGMCALGGKLSKEE